MTENQPKAYRRRAIRKSAHQPTRYRSRDLVRDELLPIYALADLSPGWPRLTRAYQWIAPGSRGTRNLAQEKHHFRLADKPGADRIGQQLRVSELLIFGESTSFRHSSSR